MRYLEQIEHNDLNEFELMTVVDMYDDELDSGQFRRPGRRRIMD